MSSEIDIRAIQPSDAIEVSYLVSQSGYDRSPQAVVDWIRFLHREQQRQAAFVVVVAQQVVGLVEVSIEHHLRRPPCAIISALLVERNFQNRGFRRLLYAHAEQWALARDVKLIRALSHRSNTRSHRFYLENGFRQTGESLIFEKPHPS